MVNLVAEPRISLCSQIGEVEFDVNDELVLGNLEWPRSEKVGVAGADTSDTLEKEPPEECAHTAVLVISSLDCEAPLRAATIFGGLKDLGSRIVVLMNNLLGLCAAWIPLLYVDGGVC
jgi:hypothetical protein